MRFAFPLMIAIVYWCLDAYQAVLNFDISFKEAILLDYAQSNSLIKLAIVIAIFIIFSIQSKVKKDVKIVKKESSTKLMDTISEITDITLSPMPLEKQINTIVDNMKKNLDIETAFIGSYENDKIKILNSDASLVRIGIKKEYLLYLENEEQDNIDSLLSTSYLEKKELVDSAIKINNISYRVLLHPYKDSYSTKHIGIVAMIMKKENSSNYDNFLKKVCELISFAANLAKRKEGAIEAQNLHNDQLLSVDRQLNIPSYTRVQDRIELEIKRSQRYKTNLSIMLIQIDHIKNLSNIFTKKEIISLKKELASFFKKNIRETDMLGKWSDTVFVIVAPNIGFRATKSFANRLNRQLKEHKFSKVGKVTCSYGITSFFPKDTIGSFRRRAENALNVAISKDESSIEIKIMA